MVILNGNSAFQSHIFAHHIHHQIILEEEYSVPVDTGDRGGIPGGVVKAQSPLTRLVDTHGGAAPVDGKESPGAQGDIPRSAPVADEDLFVMPGIGHSGKKFGGV